MRRNQLLWGVVLLLVGGLFLGDAMGLKLPNGVSLMELFWPAILLLAGAWVLLSVFFQGKVEAQAASIDLLGARTASLKIKHAAGELKIHSGANTMELAHGSFVGGLDQKVDRKGDRLEVRMRPARELFDFPLFGPHDQLDWDVALNADIATALSMDLGANKSTIDLHDMNITDLNLDTGASDTHLILPARGRFRADLDLGAASLEVVLPEGLSARIRADLGAADLKIDESRFPRRGKVYESPDYETATNSVDMNIDAGAATIKIT